MLDQLPKRLLAFAADDEVDERKGLHEQRGHRARSRSSQADLDVRPATLHPLGGDHGVVERIGVRHQAYEVVVPGQDGVHEMLVELVVVRDLAGIDKAVDLCHTDVRAQAELVRIGFQGQQSDGHEGHHRDRVAAGGVGRHAPVVQMETGGERDPHGFPLRE
jgi:hypothetical protein